MWHEIFIDVFCETIAVQIGLNLCNGTPVIFEPYNRNDERYVNAVAQIRNWPKWNAQYESKNSQMQYVQSVHQYIICNNKK